MSIAQPSKDRLVQLIRILESFPGEFVSSAELETKSGWSSNTIRKDLSSLGGCPSTNNGYPVQSLKEAIITGLGLNRPRSFCIIGLGRLGSAFLNYTGFIRDGFTLCAGFDASVNRIEVLSAPVPLYPAFKMAEVIERKKIEMALLCVPAEAANRVCASIIPAGIRAIVNFAPVVLEVPKGIQVRNIYVVDELRSLSASLHLEEITNGPSDH